MYIFQPLFTQVKSLGKHSTTSVAIRTYWLHAFIKHPGDCTPQLVALCGCLVHSQQEAAICCVPCSTPGQLTGMVRLCLLEVRAVALPSGSLWELVILGAGSAIFTLLTWPGPGGQGSSVSLPLVWPHWWRRGWEGYVSQTRIWTPLLRSCCGSDNQTLQFAKSHFHFRSVL